MTKIVECTDCGGRSLPYIGMFTPCRFNGGSHRSAALVEMEADDMATGRALLAVVPGLPWFDRDRINTSAHAAEARRLMSLAR